MPNRVPEKTPQARALAARLDRAARDVNAFLLVLAIGLAMLDVTYLWAFKMRDALPAMARASAISAAVATKPVSATGLQSTAAPAPAAAR
jgi:hypothetical protein